MNELVKVLIRISPFLIIILLMVFIIKKGKFRKEDFYIRKPVSSKKFFLWWGFFLALILLTEISLYQFGLLDVGEWKGSLLPSILKILGIVVLAPIAEELFFRGLLMHKLKQFKINLHGAVLIQAVIFLLLHSLSYDNSFSSNFAMVQVFVDAVLFAYAKEFTKSIYTPIAMHALGNFIAVLEQFIV